MERLHLISDRPATVRPASVVALAAFVGAAMALLAVAGPSRAAGHTVQAQNYAFVAPGGGSALTVTVGDQVTWKASGDPHTVTSGAPGAIDQRFTDHSASVGFLASGSTFTTTFSAAGTYPYFCEVHPEQMRGVINVVALVTTPPTPTKRPTPQPTSRATAAPSTVPPTAPPPASPTTPGASSAGSPTPTSSAADSGLPNVIGTQTPPPNGAVTAGGSAGGAGSAPIVIAIVLVIAALSLGAAILGRRRRSSG